MTCMKISDIPADLYKKKFATGKKYYFSML